MREIVLDTETTGLYFNAGHRIIEVACIELWDHLPTGRVFHRYVNPLIGMMPQQAFDVHGLRIQFLWNFVPFPKIANDLLEFIRDSPIVAHNSAFDVGFINYELMLAGLPELRSETIDTLPMARKQFKGASNSLDALCRRFNIDLSRRQFHGAAIDCELLAAVYLELIGGRQPLFTIPKPGISPADLAAASASNRQYRPPRQHPPVSDIERVAFGEMLAKVRNPLWAEEDTSAMVHVWKPEIKELLDDEIPF